jgi:tetratricopeptide (TPR) repeat protein
MKKLMLMLLMGINLMSYADLAIEDINNDLSSDYTVYEEDSTYLYEDNMEKGDAAYLDENYSDSLGFYMEAFKAKEDDIDALFGIAKSYEEMNQIDKALGVYRKILKLDPKNVEANKKDLLLNEENISTWNYKQKEKYFEKFEKYLKKNHYDNSDDIYTLGRIYMNDKSFERAYNIFKKDTQGDYRNYFGAATTARFLGKYDTSIKYYNKLLATNPDFYMGYLGLASVYKIKGNYDAAIKNLEKYLSYKEDENAYVGIANIYMAQDKYKEAKAILEEGQNKFPDSAAIRKSLGEIYSRSK